MYKAMVVDDHPFIRASVRMLLQNEQFEVVAEAANGVEAVQQARVFKPDLIILDISLPKLDGLEVLERIGASNIRSKILVLTSQEATLYAVRCLHKGAVGYVSKTAPLDQLSSAVKTVMTGRTFFPNLGTCPVRSTDHQVTDLELIQSLTDRELAILQQLSYGRTNKDIGDAMLLSNKTISTYKARIIEKLQVQSVVYLADFAKRNRLV